MPCGLRAGTRHIYYNAAGVLFMAHSDHPRPSSTERRTVLSALTDYRAEQDAWQSQAQALVELRAKVLVAADRHAGEIVDTARAEIRRVLVDARGELLVLAAQLQAMADARHQQPMITPDRNAHVVGMVGVSELHDAKDALRVARQQMRSILDDARPELQNLSDEAGVLRARLASPHADAAPDVAAMERHDTSDVIPVARQQRPNPLDEARSDLQNFANEARVLLDNLASPQIDAAPHVGATMHSDLAQVPERAFLTHTPHVHSLTRIFMIVVIVGFSLSIGSVVWLKRGTSDNYAPPSVPAVAITQRVPARSPVPIPPAPSVPAGVSPSATVAVPPNRAGLSMAFEVRRDAWMRVQVDGRVVSARLFKTGERQHIVDAHDVSIRIGDAGAVRTSVNGGPPTALGQDGQVVTRHFAAEEPPRQSVAQIAPPASPLSASIGLQTLPALPRRERTAASIVPATGAPTEPATPPPPAALQPSAEQRIPSTASLQQTIVSAAQQWLDAYYRDDLQAMATRAAAGLTISDFRTSKERIPAGLTEVRRTLEEVKFQSLADTAIITATMTERAQDGTAAPVIAVSLISQTWKQQQGAWCLTQVRIVNPSSLNGGR
jgi:hypothetical protein